MTNLQINFSEREEKILRDLAKEKGMTFENMLKQAARLYQTLDVRIKKGKIQQSDVNALLSDPRLNKRG